LSEEEWTKTTFRLPKSLLKRVKHLATDLEKSDTEIFNEALEKFLKGAEKK
jgi:predicted transcriptional regulator